MAISGSRATPPAASLAHIDTWVFDLDNTLYPASCNLFAEIQQRMGRYVADLLGVGMDAARAVQKQYFLNHGTTLRGLMIHHGIDADAFLDYVHRIDLSPVQPSPTLDSILRRLPGRKLVFTNASMAHGERVLDRLGIRGRFDAIFDVAAAGYLPKPNAEPYRLLVERHEIEPRRAAMVEDMARNLVPAAEMGMTTVWVRHAELWSHDGADDGHIHHVVEDLEAWLAALVGETP